jgi:hypothetical protein
VDTAMACSLGNREMEGCEKSPTLGCDAFRGLKGMYRKQCPQLRDYGLLIGHLPPSPLLGDGV